MDEITQIALKVPEPLVEISENGLATLKLAEQQRGFAKSIHTTVTNSLKDLTGYSKENRPDEMIRTPFEYGGITGRVESKPTSSVSYKTVFDEFNNYLRHEHNINRTKLLKTEELVGSFYDWLDNATNPTLEQKMYFDNEEEILIEAGITDERPEATTFFNDTSNYTNLNKDIILSRFKAKRIDDYLSNEIIKPFDRLLEETALDRLGLDADNLQETARITLSQDNRAFDVKVISRPTIGYRSILMTLFNDKITRATGRSGEIFALIDKNVENVDDLIQQFDVKNRMTGRYVSLKRVARRLDELTAEHTKIKKRLEWTYNPILEFAAIAD
jgi:hypothetical protein